MKNNAATWTLAGGAIVVAFAAVNVALDESNLTRLRQQSEAVTHTYEVSAALAAVVGDKNAHISGLEWLQAAERIGIEGVDQVAASIARRDTWSGDPGRGCRRGRCGTSPAR